MTIGGFILGILIAGIGFLMLWQGHKFREYVGDLDEIFQVNASWLDWPVLGAALIFIGIFVAFGLFQAIAGAVLGPVFAPQF